MQAETRGELVGRPSPARGAVDSRFAQRHAVAAFFGLAAEALTPLGDAVIEAMAARLEGRTMRLPDTPRR